MNYPIISRALFLLISIHFFNRAQSQSDSSYSYKYEPVTEDVFQGFDKAKLKLDYYFTEGISTGDRYMYEVIVIDSVLMLAFSAPETDTYKYISYEKKLLLTEMQQQEIKSAILNAKLKQIKVGIPIPDGSAHIKEVLIVQFKNINIKGGFAYSNLYPDNESNERIKKKMKADRLHSSSIGGNYDLLIKTVKNYFKDLPNLMKEAEK